MASVTNYSVILSNLTSLLATVTGIANIHAYQRHVADWSAMLALFKRTVTTGAPPNEVSVSTIQGWTVSRSASTEEWITNCEVLRVHEFRIRGILGVQDSAATEDTFNDLIEAISDIARRDFPTNTTAEWHDAIQWPVIDYRVFNGVLCHYCEGIAKVRERLPGGN